MRRVAVHEPDDEAAGGGLGGLDDELGPHGVGQRLAVVAVAGVDDLDVRAAVAGDDVLAGHLVDDDDVGGGEELQRTRTVMSPESPGPAPTKATRPGTRL